MAKETVVSQGIAVSIPETQQSALKSSFYAERSSFIDEVTRQAQQRKMDKFAYYAALLFENALTARFEYAKTRQTKVLQGAIGVLIASGKSEQEARKMLGLGE